MLEEEVTSAFLLLFTIDVDEPIEETPWDNCEVADLKVVVEIVDETLGVVGFAGDSHFTLKFPFRPP